MRRYRWAILGSIIQTIFLIAAFAPVELTPNNISFSSFFGGRSTEAKLLSFETLEIADTQSERARGYMDRTDICDDCGMLFIFETESVRTFWMKNTPTSLDIFFLNNEGQVVALHTNTTPFQTVPPYSSAPFQVKYVLEAKAGYARYKGIDRGDYIDLTFLRDQGVEYGNGEL